MKKLLTLAILLCLAGGFVYFRLLSTPEARICDRMAALCDSDAEDAASCERDLSEARRMLGDHAIERVEGCVDGSKTCVEAAACIGTGLTREALDDVVKGIGRGLRD